LAIIQSLIQYFLTGLVLGPAFSTDLLAADLTVEVHGLRSNKGDIHIAIYNAPETFPDSDGMIQESQNPITGLKAKHRFADLDPGAYAIATYHDENANNDFDTNLIGLPLEGYAFSNDARAFFGPPRFDSARIELGPMGSTIRIKMGY